MTTMAGVTQAKHGLPKAWFIKGMLSCFLMFFWSERDLRHFLGENQTGA